MGQREIAAREKMFYEMVDALSDDAQDYVSALSNAFLEADVYRRFVSNDASVEWLQKELNGLGLDDAQVEVVMEHFGLNNGPGLARAVEAHAADVETRGGK